MVTFKKIILLALTVLMMVGCDAIETNIPLEKTNVKIGGWSGYIFKIDSCEYIRLGHGVTHKGNCKFCKERDSIKWEKRKKELEELVEQLKEK